MVASDRPPTATWYDATSASVVVLDQWLSAFQCHLALAVDYEMLMAVVGSVGTVSDRTPTTTQVKDAGRHVLRALEGPWVSEDPRLRKLFFKLQN